jgi:hypothetical protein
MGIEIQQRACPNCRAQMVVEVQVTEAYGLGRIRERVIRGECPNGCELEPADFNGGPPAVSGGDRGDGSVG